jgi:protein involved in polysaccharide export with SLBB domain
LSSGGAGIGMNSFIRIAALQLCILATCAAGVAQSGAPVAPDTAVRQSGEYRLGINDKVRLLVFDESELSGEFAVNSNGALSLPLIGDVPAAGKTASEVRQVIEQRLASGYLVNPRVSLEVRDFQPFYILGEVNKPGEYPYSDGLTVQQAVATAQGYTYRAEKKRVFIKKNGETREEEIRLSADTKISPGDTIRVGERYF